MITPSFGLTATERVLPKLALDFATASLDSRVTFTRTTDATHPAAYVNSGGLIAAATNNQPRFDYDPSTLLCKGFLIEESRTNLCLQTADQTVSPWVIQQIGTGTITRTQNYSIAPDGTTTATRLEMSLNGGGGSTSNYCTLLQPIAVTSGTAYTASFYAKTNDGSTKTISLRDESSAATFNTLKTVSGSWQRITVTGTAAATASANFKIWLRGGIGTSTDADLSVWGFQWEAGEDPATSYIPTTTTALTRNPDIATITGTNFSGFWRAGPGSILVRALPSTVSGTRPLVQVDDNTADNIIALRGNTTNPELYIREGGADKATIDAGTISAAAYRLAGAWQAGSAAASLNSGLAVTNSGAVVPTVTQMRLGSDGTNYLNGHLQAVEYYDERVLNANLQLLSSSAGRQGILRPLIRNAI